MNVDRRERAYTATDWLRDFFEEQGVHVKESYLAERADDFRSLVLAALLDELGITEQDVRRLRGGKDMPYPTHVNAERKIANALATLLEASR